MTKQPDGCFARGLFGLFGYSRLYRKSLFSTLFQAENGCTQNAPAVENPNGDRFEISAVWHPRTLPVFYNINSLGHVPMKSHDGHQPMTMDDVSYRFDLHGKKPPIRLWTRPGNPRR